MMLDKRSPEPGVGCWGCFVCGAPQAGAVAVLCDDCLDARANPKFACLGEPAENRRILAGHLQPFGHDKAKHADDDLEYAAEEEDD